VQKRRGSVTAAELTARLEADPDWVARRDARERNRTEREQQSHIEQAPLLNDLQAIGIVVNNVNDLVNTATPYPQALPVLLRHFSNEYSERTLEGIARALAVKDARLIAWDHLIASLREKLFSKELSDAIMVAISAMARPTDLECLIDLIKDDSLGSCRIFLVSNLMRSKRKEARNVLFSLRYDPDLKKEIAIRLKV